MSKIIRWLCLLLYFHFMKQLQALIASAGIMTAGLQADDAKNNMPIWDISIASIMAWEDIWQKSSLGLTTDTIAGKIHFYLTHGDDPRVWAEDFTSGGISLAIDNITLWARGLLLDNESFGEIYGKYMVQFPECMEGVDAWIRIGLTNPKGVSMSGGANVQLTDDDSLFLLGSHQEGMSDGPQGSLWKAELTHNFGNGISVYGGIDYVDGDDASFPRANQLDKNGAWFHLFRLHGQWFTGNIGTKYSHNDTNTHLGASYNEEGYWNFTGEISQKLLENLTLSGGVLVDSREGRDPTGYIGLKLSF